MQTTNVSVIRFLKPSVLNQFWDNLFYILYFSIFFSFRCKDWCPGDTLVRHMCCSRKLWKTSWQNVVVAKTFGILDQKVGWLRSFVGQHGLFKPNKHIWCMANIYQWKRNPAYGRPFKSVLIIAPLPLHSTTVL